MTRRHPKRRIMGGHFAAIPDEVLKSPACSTLPHYACRLLLIAAAHYRGRNNGDIALTGQTVRAYGFKSQEQLVTGLAMLLERGLLIKVRQGGKRPLGPCLYAVSWQPVDDLRHKNGVTVGPTNGPPNTWASWVPVDVPLKRARTSKEKATGLPAVRVETTGGAISGKHGTAGGLWSGNNGTTGSPPSRSRGGNGTTLQEQSQVGVHGSPAPASAGVRVSLRVVP